ncbi:MAG TPA: metallopeptidase family protein [bacterium (Candidatus Stahlbacteria)]|nr:metallopeptidase family protein [Candidatus Stahlbacteria bacterium]
MSEIKDLVDETIAELPPEIQKKISDVEIVIDEDDPPSPYLLGLYQGVPIRKDPARRAFYPHRIYLYIRNIRRYAKDKEGMKVLIKRVLMHEIGHHIGFSDGKLTDLGY